MKIEIPNPLELILEIGYLNGCLNGREMPELININNMVSEIKEKLHGGKK